MLLGLGGYKPHEIRNKKDPAQLELEQCKKYRLVSDKKQEKTTDNRPEGDLGHVWDSLKTLARIELRLTDVEDAFAQMIEVAQKATDIKRNDKDRIMMDKRFQGAMRNYDFVVADVKLKGIPIFSASSKKEVELSTGEDEKASIPVEACDLRINSFNLGKLRLDTIIKARGVIKKLAIVETAIKKRNEKLVSKETYLITKLLQSGIQPPDFKKTILAEIEAKRPGAKTKAVKKIVQTGEGLRFADIESHDPLVLALRREQETRARNKGRQQALLVNIKA